MCGSHAINHKHRLRQKTAPSPRRHRLHCQKTYYVTKEYVYVLLIRLGDDLRSRCPLEWSGSTGRSPLKYYYT